MNSGASAPSTPLGALGRGSPFARPLETIARWLEAERDQLPLWLPVMLGLGIANWFLLPDAPSWLALIAAVLGLAMAGLAVGLGQRAGVALLVAGLAIASGCALIWAKAERVAAPKLTRPVIASFEAEAERVQQLAARESVPAVLRPLNAPDLPPRIRVNIPEADAPPGSPAATVSACARD